MNEAEFSAEHFKDWRARSTVLLQLIGMEPMKTGYGDPDLWLDKNGRVQSVNIYYPDKVELAWKVHIWAFDGLPEEQLREYKIWCWDHYPLDEPPPFQWAAFQKDWLDKIYDLAHGAGVIQKHLGRQVLIYDGIDVYDMSREELIDTIYWMEDAREALAREYEADMETMQLTYEEMLGMREVSPESRARKLAALQALKDASHKAGWMDGYNACSLRATGEKAYPPGEQEKEIDRAKEAHRQLKIMLGIPEETGKTQ